MGLEHFIAKAKEANVDIFRQKILDKCPGVKDVELKAEESGFGIDIQLSRNVRPSVSMGTTVEALFNRHVKPIGLGGLLWIRWKF
jgi:hypothetical protein